MTKRNYKVFAAIGTITANRVRTLTILDTGAGPNLIRKDTLPIGYETYLKPGPLPNICDANGNRMDMQGIITLAIELGGYRLCLYFIICNGLATTCILGTDFCDRFVEAIRPKAKLVELDNGTTIPIIRNPRTPPPISDPTPQQDHTPTAP